MILEKIISSLRERRLPAETELTEGEIAKKLALSRSTVRLAITIIAKAQQECPAVSYHPPHGTQRSRVIFAKAEVLKNTRGVMQVKRVNPQKDPINISPASKTEDTIICPRCKARQPFTEAWQLYASGAEVKCEGCGFDLRKVVEHWSEANGE